IKEDRSPAKIELQDFGRQTGSLAGRRCGDRIRCVEIGRCRFCEGLRHEAVLHCRCVERSSARRSSKADNRDGTAASMLDALTRLGGGNLAQDQWPTRKMN